jgi:hypothetical protein
VVFEDVTIETRGNLIRALAVHAAVVHPPPGMHLPQPVRELTALVAFAVRRRFNR